MDQIDIDEIGIKEKIKEEVERFKKFQQVLLGKVTNVRVPEVDIRNCAKYLLREGKDVEKRELLSNLRSRLILKEKRLTLQ
jgi:hypothetical protein